jgi:hypothetical protein
MSEIEQAAWAAGFFDGEGTIGLVGRPGQPGAAMSIQQASSCGVPETLERFREIVRAGSITGPRMVASPWSRLPQYRWQVGRFVEIERVVAMLYPYGDIVKREQMTRCLELVRASRSSRS